MKTLLAPSLEAPNLATRPTVADVLRLSDPDTATMPAIRDWRLANLPTIHRGLAKFRTMELSRAPIYWSMLFLHNLRANGDVEYLGLAGLQMVTNAGVNAVRDGFLGTFTLSNLKYHGIGTGTNAPATSDTALQTELTTQYNPDSTRATGSQVSNGTGDYRTVGTNTVDAGVAITEYGIFSQAATGGGTLLDRFQFSADNLASGDSIQGTFDITFPSGS